MLRMRLLDMVVRCGKPDGEASGGNAHDPAAALAAAAAGVGVAQSGAVGRSVFPNEMSLPMGIEMGGGGLVDGSSEMRVILPIHASTIRDSILRSLHLTCLRLEHACLRVIAPQSAPELARSFTTSNLASHPKNFLDARSSNCHLDPCIWPQASHCIITTTVSMTIHIPTTSLAIVSTRDNGSCRHQKR